MAFALGPQAKGAGYRLISFEAVDSTNAEAMRCLQGGEALPLWVAARGQTAGRGRRGRMWQTQIGNLAASVLVEVEVKPGGAATLGFAAGIATRDALRRCAPELDVALKWPNDVLVDGAKIGGILLEAEQRNGKLAVVVGIGVNIVSVPELPGYPVTSLATLGSKAKAEDVFLELAETWVDAFAIWDGGRGIADIRARWLESAAGLGGSVRIESDGTTIEGVFETLDPSGHLIVRVPDGRLIPVTAGDVYFGDARSAARPGGAV